MDKYKQAFNNLHKPHNIVVTYVNILQELALLFFFFFFFMRVLIETRGRNVNKNLKSRMFFVYFFSSLECIINYIKLETEFPE